MRRAPSAVRRELRNRLLVQFGELGLRAGGRERDSGAVAEMAGLLPAVAEAADALDDGVSGARGAAEGWKWVKGGLSCGDDGCAVAVPLTTTNGASHKADAQLVKVRLVHNASCVPLRAPARRGVPHVAAEQLPMPCRRPWPTRAAGDHQCQQLPTHVLARI